MRFGLSVAGVIGALCISPSLALAQPSSRDVDAGPDADAGANPQADTEATAATLDDAGVAAPIAEPAPPPQDGAQVDAVAPATGAAAVGSAVPEADDEPDPKTLPNTGPTAGDVEASPPDATNDAAAKPPASEPKVSNDMGTPTPRLEGPPEIIVLPLTRANVDEATGKIVDGVIANAFSDREGLIVTTADDIRTMLDIESEREMLDCAEESESCMVDLAHALGARYVVNGQIGELDDIGIIQVVLFDSYEARTVSREEIRYENASDLPELIDTAVVRLVAPLPGQELPDEGTPLGVWLLAGGAGALALAAVALVGGAAAGLATTQLIRSPFDRNYVAAQQQATAMSIVANALYAAATVSAAGALGLGAGGAALLVFEE